ncbi:hypothetical protein NC651_009394 [Populus alba x Populus x berolinensis]|nr:hypothetical protein NC651_009394 [Populus alba x Populus x berolinensis]
MPDGRQQQHNLSPPLAIACLLLLLWLMLIAIAHGSEEQYTWKSILNNIHVMVLLIETSFILIHRVIRHNLVTSRPWPGQGSGLEMRCGPGKGRPLGALFFSSELNFEFL